MIKKLYIRKKIVLPTCNTQQGFKPVFVGEFRWHVKHLSDQVRKNTRN